MTFLAPTEDIQMKKTLILLALVVATGKKNTINDPAK
jgi:hypothetical protein